MRCVDFFLGKSCRWGMPHRLYGRVFSHAIIAELFCGRYGHPDRSILRCRAGKEWKNMGKDGLEDR